MLRKIEMYLGLRSKDSRVPSYQPPGAMRPRSKEDSYNSTPGLLPWAGRDQPWAHRAPVVLVGQALVWWGNRIEKGRKVPVLGREAYLKSQVQWGTGWCGLPACYLEPWRCLGQGYCQWPCLALTQLWRYVLISVAPLTTKGPVDIWRLGYHLWPCWGRRDVPPQGHAI